jgi:hypothetical protein
MTLLTDKQKARFRVLLAEKLQRLAYELEHDAARSRDFMRSDMSDAILAISSDLGNLARRMKPA